MPKTFKIVLEVEEIALGPVLRKVNDMPGVVEFKLDLGEGGMGAGRKQLEEAAATLPRGGAIQAVISLLMDGPKHVNDIKCITNGKLSSAYTITSKLRKQGIIESGAHKGTYQLTPKVRAELGNSPALPSPELRATPSQIPDNSSSRAARGAVNVFLKNILSEGSKSWTELRDAAVEHGVSVKSINNALYKAKGNGLVKKNGTGWALTAKGEKIDVEVAAHG